MMVQLLEPLNGMLSGEVIYAHATTSVAIGIYKMANMEKFLAASSIYTF